MLVNEVMHGPVYTCSSSDSLETAARLMWEHDCGSVVVTDQGKAMAVVTDRDVCMAAYIQGCALKDIVVSSAASKALFAVRPEDDLETVEAMMRDKQVRRVPVVDATGTALGIVTLNDLVRDAGQLGRRRHALSAEALVRTMAAIGTPAARDA